MWTVLRLHNNYVLNQLLSESKKTQQIENWNFYVKIKNPWEYDKTATVFIKEKFL